MRQSRPYYDPGFQVKVLKPFNAVSSFLVLFGAPTSQMEDVGGAFCETTNSSFVTDPPVGDRRQGLEFTKWV
jgi:hypothetical protein